MSAGWVRDVSTIRIWLNGYGAKTNQEGQRWKSAACWLQSLGDYIFIEFLYVLLCEKPAENK